MNLHLLTRVRKLSPETELLYSTSRQSSHFGLASIGILECGQTIIAASWHTLLLYIGMIFNVISIKCFEYDAMPPRKTQFLKTKYEELSPNQVCKLLGMIVQLKKCLLILLGFILLLRQFSPTLGLSANLANLGKKKVTTLLFLHQWILVRVTIGEKPRSVMPCPEG